MIIQKMQQSTFQPFTISITIQNPEDMYYLLNLANQPIAYIMQGGYKSCLSEDDIRDRHKPTWQMLNDVAIQSGMSTDEKIDYD